MVRAKRARTAERPTQPSLDLRSRAPWFYPDPHFRDGQLIHGYVVKPAPCQIEIFSDVIRDSYSDAATFMNVVVIERFSPDRSLRFHNFTITESTFEGALTTRLASGQI